MSRMFDDPAKTLERLRKIFDAKNALMQNLQPFPTEGVDLLRTFYVSSRHINQGRPEKMESPLVDLPTKAFAWLRGNCPPHLLDSTTFVAVEEDLGQGERSKTAFAVNINGLLIISDTLPKGA